MNIRKPIFLYTPGATMTPALLNRISKAGYVAVPVENMDAVKVVEAIAGIGPISRAAFDTLATCNGPYSGVAEDFGRRVAKALGTQPAAPK